MTHERLDDCRQPDRNLFELAGDDHRVVFAVAYREGIVQNVAEQYEFEGLAVLFLTADGERVVEQWVRATQSGLGDISRAFVCPTSKLDDADEHAKRFAPVVGRHPEP